MSWEPGIADEMASGMAKGKSARGLALFASICLVACAAPRTEPPASEHDLVIYGGTSADVIAAVQARVLGKSVVLVCPDGHVGGLSAGGLGWTDSGDKAVIGGRARDFYRRVKARYDDPAAWRQQRPEEFSRYVADADAMWVFEPHVAEAVFEGLLREFEIPVHRNAWLDREGDRRCKGVAPFRPSESQRK